MPRIPGCTACGEIVTSFHKLDGRLYCRECFEEKTEGVVRSDNPVHYTRNQPSEPMADRYYHGGYGSETLHRFGSTSEGS